jgi:hypothetical protein
MFKVKDKEFVKPLLDEITKEWEKLQTKPYTHLSFQNFLLYHKTGNRLKYEEQYFLRRKELLVTGLYAIINRSEVAIKKLEEVIFLVLQEYTWALPAHLNPNFRKKEEITGCIDLFSAETAQTLAEIVYQLKDELTPELITFINEEIELRIFKPLNGKCWHWEQLENNWSAVIAGSIGMAALRLIEDKERLNSILKRLRTSFESFLRGFGEDGACVEGISYWTYGFGYYTYFAQTLAEVMNDNSYFELPKVKEIAKFPYYAEISNGKFLPFGDCNQTPVPSGLLSFLSDKFNVEVPNIEKVSTLNSDHCYRFATMIFNLKYSMPKTFESNKKSIHFFKNRQWLIANDREHNIFFAAKGGRNDESHNHNDLGHFVYGSSHLPLTDLGAGEYTKDYFNKDKRYTYFVNSSLSHSVPIINGKLQQAGSYESKLVEFKESNSEVIFCLELKEAYSENVELLSFIRKFTLDKTTFELNIKDSFKFSSANNEIIENFITQGEVILSENKAFINDNGSQVIISTPTNISVVKKDYKNHHGKQANAYLIQNVLKVGVEVEIIYKISVNN